MLTISLNSQDVERGLNQLLRNIQHRQPMMQGIAAELLSMTEDNFERESWGNEPWQPTHRGGKILQLSGQLAASIHTLATYQRAQFGSNKIYAAIHHIGGDIHAQTAPYLMIPLGNGRFARKTSVTIPARPYLPINGNGALQSDGKSRILDVARDALAHGL